MNKLTTTALLLTAILVPTSLQAGHNSPLTNAASDYRDAVVDFELLVIRARYVDRYDVRLVDDLEDSTSELRSASRDPFRGRRFSHAWDDVSSLHHRVEARIFGHGNYPADAELSRCWQAVVCAYTDLDAEVNHLTGVGNPHASIIYEEVIVPARPHVISPEITVPHTTVPHTTVPHATVPHATAPPNVTIPEIYLPPASQPITPIPPTIVPPTTVPPTIVPNPEVRFRPAPEVHIPEVYVPTPRVQTHRYDVPAHGRSVHIENSHSRTIARPTIGISRGVHIERYRGYGSSPSYYAAGNQDVGAAIAGAILTRILTKNTGPACGL